MPRLACFIPLCLYVLSLALSPAVAQPVCPNRGDVNNDGVLTPGDAQLALQHFLGTAPPPRDECEISRANVIDVDSNTITPADVVCIFQEFLDLRSCIGMAIEVSGQVRFDTDAPVPGATITASIVTEQAIAAVRAVRRASHVDVYAPDAKQRKLTPQTQPPEPTLAITGQVDVVTDANGNFAVTVLASMLPARVLLEVDFLSPGMPPIHSARVVDATGQTVDAGVIILPSLEGAEVALQNGSGQSQDGSVQVEGLPPEIMQVFARSYDPDATPGAFPGEFRELGIVPLNSSVFAWIEALDASGAVVTNLSQMATLRVRVPRTQWADLEDINGGTDRIELPIYLFNESLNMWEQRPEVGWIEDGEGAILPEEAQSLILNGTFEGDLFAAFPTNHLSWFNVDYAFIGPWTLSRLEINFRNNSCLFESTQLARTIALSTMGRQAYARVNQVSADITIELANGQGPELKNVMSTRLRDADGNEAWGQYKGDAGGSETQFEMNNDLWNSCREGATVNQERNTTLLMTVTILHQTAYWKDDVKKFPPDAMSNEPIVYDTPGAEGLKLERDLFGGIVDMDTTGRITLDGNRVLTSTVSAWLDPASWPAPMQQEFVVTALPQQQEPSPLTVTISTTQNTFNLGEEIPVQVTYENVSSSPIEVMNRVILEGYPLYFDITNRTTGVRAAFLSPEVKLRLPSSRFTTLQPGQTMTLTANLVRNPTTGALLYQLINSGMYDITAVYETLRGVPETRSNTLAVTLNAGGRLIGQVANATNGQVLAGATVRVFQDANLLATATTNDEGVFFILELPAGTYRLEARAAGFLRNIREGVTIVAGEDTVEFFNLSILLTAGTLRFEMRWGERPVDLDAHLWLPVERPYHLFFPESRRGSLAICPFALLDEDDTTSFGPEIITIRQRFPGTYVYAVNKFPDPPGEPPITESAAEVRVFDARGLVATFHVPTTGEGEWWDVLRIDGETGRITEINTVGDDPSPYPDTDMGCTQATTQ